MQRSRLQILLRSHGMLEGGSEQLRGNEVQGRVHDVPAGNEAGHGDPLLSTQVLIDGLLMLQVRQAPFVSRNVTHLRTSAASSNLSIEGAALHLIGPRLLQKQLCRLTLDYLLVADSKGKSF